jgi:GT2 family glycosyltransferase
MITYPSVSLIVVNYKGASKFKDLLLDCVRSLAETNYPNFEIVFVDNASDDGSSELIMENFPLPNLRVERLPANVGYAGAANAGLRVANGEIMGILNNDLVVTPDWLNPLVELLSKEPDVGIVSPVLLRDPRTIDSLGGEVNVLMVAWDRKSTEPASKINSDEPMYVMSPPGAAFLFRRELLRDFDNRIFDEDYFAYYEDVALGIQCNLMGHKVAIEPKSRILHLRGSSWGSISPEKFFLLRRNSIWTGIIVFDPIQMIFMLPSWVVSTIYGGILYYRLTSNSAYLRVSFQVLFALAAGFRKAWLKHLRFGPRKVIPVESIGLSPQLILDTDRQTILSRLALGLVNLAACLAGLKRFRITSTVKYPLLDRIYLVERR